MNLFNFFQKILLVLCCVLYSTSISSQQLAKADAINALDVIMKSFHYKPINPSEDLYNDVWNNSAVNCYKTIDIPNKYVVNIKDFSMPIKYSNINITSNYGYRKTFKRYHKGIDLKVYTGDTIYATFSGKVRIRKYDARGYGYYIVIRHFNGLETVYGHMSKQLVKENEYVYAGQPIGLGGNTGHSFGSHLHLEVRFCGIPIDPLDIFSFKYKDVTDDTYIFIHNKE